MTVRTLTLLLGLLLFNAIKGSSMGPQMILHRIDGEFIFDGKADEPFWNTITPLQLVMHSPVFGKDPSEKSDIRIAYNNAYIFVSAKLYDRDASKIMSTSRKRDEMSNGNDRFTIIFDSFNDKENGLAFSTTPSGLRHDYTIFKDAMTVMPEMPLNVSWNTFWDVKTIQNNEGWSLEMRIPLSSLRFKEVNGKVTMGLICFREIPHNNELDIFPAIPPNWGFFSNFRPSQAHEVVFTDIKSHKPFYIAPYVIGGLQQENVLNNQKDAYRLKNSPTLNAGLDVKYGLTNNLTLDLTYNTDFAQVEADDQMINLTRFSLFFPEKRTFFQERSSIFNFDFETGNSLFYSRRIGLSGGEQVPIYGGTRITGMVGKWDIGLLDLQTHKFNSDLDATNNLPSENFGVLRMRRNVINPNSYIGGIVTSRMGMNGKYNLGYGADATIKVIGNDYLNVKVAQIMADSAENKMASLDASQLYLSWKRFSTNGLGYNVAYSRSGKDYNPAMGFQMRSNYSFYTGSLSYGWMRSEKSPIMTDNLELQASDYELNSTHEMESRMVNLNYFAMFKKGFGAFLSLSHQWENVIEQFSFSDNAYIPIGKYQFDLFEMHCYSPESKKLFVRSDMWTGTYYDGTRVSISANPNWNASTFLQLGITYGIDWLKFSNRGQTFTGHLAKLNAQLMFSTKLSISSYIQYNSNDNNIFSNLKLRYNPSEGNDLFIVYNEGRNTNLTREIPNLPELGTRTIMIKYTYTFSL